MSNDSLYAMRHSLAHITAQAVQHLWPEAKFGVGPVVENGFYYDIDLGDTKISEDDFNRIEAEMKLIIANDYKFEQTDKPIEMALDWAKNAKQPYKEELLNDLKRAGTTVAKELDSDELGLPSEGQSAVDSVSFYSDGDFTDLCRGPHVSSTSKVGAFKLMRVAGAYWRGNEKNRQMQRLYGLAFATQAELDDHLKLLEEAKLRDHRRLGQELDLFIISDLVGAGLPLFTPRGTVLREELGRYTQELRAERGFMRVWTPHIAKTDLYKTSGHWDKFGEELFLVKSQETDDNFVLKPMNCPHHIQIYASQPRSYRDLPLKYMENAVDYRDEKTGELHGLSRVRAFTQDDSHVFARQDQIEQIAGELIDAAQQMYQQLGMQLKFTLSFRDQGPGYLGEPALWDKAQSTLEQLVQAKGLDYTRVDGEAAFYGPKVDFIATDALQREWQLATVQLDFVQPDRFGLEYTNDSGDKERPVMIHCALLGSIERFLSVYIEHTAGRFPLWLAPEQLRIIQVKDSDEVKAFVDELCAAAVDKAIRFTVDDSNESVGKKIRAAEVMKVPYTVVVGEKEVSERKLTPRIRSDLRVPDRPEIDSAYEVEQFFMSLRNEVKSRVSVSSM